MHQQYTHRLHTLLEHAETVVQHDRASSQAKLRALEDRTAQHVDNATAARQRLTEEVVQLRSSSDSERATLLSERAH